MTGLVETLIQNKKHLLTDENITPLMDFDTSNKANGNAELTRYGQMQILIRFISFIKKNFKDVTRKDVEAYLASREVKSYTLDGEKTVIKKFYKYLNNSELYPDNVKWITLNNDYTYKKPSDMLTETEIKRLIEKCDNLRDRCIVVVLDDTAIRVGELCNLDNGDVHNDGEHMSITVKGKTGERSIGLITSAPIMNEYLNLHPDKNNSEAPLFISLNQKTYGNRLTDVGVYQMLQVLRKRAGIKKKVTPHIFRHSTLTRYAGLRMNESQMRMFAGWTADSSMPEVYLHMTEEEVDDNRRAMMTGDELKKKKPEKSMMLPIRCPRCGKQNDSNNTYCISCWLPLTRESIDRDIQITTAFRSKYMKMVMDIDGFVNEYYQFKTTTEDYLEFYKAFGGKLSVSMDTLHEKLQWPRKRSETFINGLVECGVVKIEYGSITIQTYEFNGVQKSVFDNFLMFQKML